MGARRKVAAWFIGAFPELLLVIAIIIFVIAVASSPGHVGRVEGVLSGNSPSPGATNERIFHLIQVSDVHLSKFNPTRAEQLTTFCNETIPTIKPSLVLNTGDLVDAVQDADSFYYLNRQWEEEWETYRSILESAGYYNRSFWLDLRGNHDAFGIPKYDDPQNYYVSYAVYGDRPQYSYVISQPFGTYQVVAVDLSFLTGASSPFNFFGIPHQGLQEVRGFLEDAVNHNHTLLIGHFPRVTSSPFFPWADLTSKHVIAYLCGHLHTKDMYKKMPGGYYELELADMKNTRRYRIMAFDHDLFSFQDVFLHEWPAILITNPKNPQFYSELEPLDLIASSTHIRVLVFSPRPILSVTISLNQGPARNMTRVEADQPLFILEWNPLDFGPGLHTINVTAVDPERSNFIFQSFSVDKTTQDIDRSLGNIAQNTPIVKFAIVTFAFLYFYSFFIMLLLPRIWSWKMKGRVEDPNEVEPLFTQVHEPTFKQLFKAVWMNKIIQFQSLSTVSWWIMVFWWVYLLAGPIVAGPIINEDLYGVAFFWGVIANGEYSRSAESFLVAWVLLLFLYTPFLTTLIRLDHATSSKKSPINFGFLFHLILFLVACCLCLFLLTIYETWTGLLLSPSISYFILSALALLIWRSVVYWRLRRLRNTDLPINLGPKR